MKTLNSSLPKGSLGLLFIGLFLLPSLLPSQNFVTTYAGTGLTGLQDGDTLTAQFGRPSEMDLDPFGNFIVTDIENAIRKISPNGTVTTLAGNGVAGMINAQGGNARFNGPYHSCVDSVGNVYVSDLQNNRVRKIDVNANVTTLAGSGLLGYVDGPALTARFEGPRGLCMDSHGNLFIADSWNHRIRKLDPNGNISTFAGGGTSMGQSVPGDWADGQDTSARFWTPTALEIDAQDNLYVADTYNHRIRKITPQGMVTTIAGSGPGGSTSGSYLDGAAQTARFNTPIGLSVDAQGDVYVADTYNNCIRYISNGMVTTAAGSQTAGYQNGNSAQALFDHPLSTLVGTAGNWVYVLDTRNHVIRKITLNLTIGLEGPVATEMSPSVYPNPASNQLRIQLPKGVSLDQATISILDLSGKTVMGEREFVVDTPLDVTTLPKGLYLAQLKAEGKFHRLKFVKE